MTSEKLMQSGKTMSVIAVTSIEIFKQQKKAKVWAAFLAIFLMTPSIRPLLQEAENRI